MLFSSITFIYYFLPIVLGVYFIVPKKLKNIVLLLSSFIFYFWGEPQYSILMLFMTFIGYIGGRLLDKYRGTKKSKVFFISTLVLELGALGVFKYANFFVDTINKVFNSEIDIIQILLPIGISFYTFQILSYVIDLYNSKVEVQKNFINFATYVTLFPQLIAGPIVRYIDVERELKNRTHSFENFSYGVNRFIIGLSKKVLIANILGEFCDIAKNTENNSIVLVWAYAFFYALHIYFDFSGYSDMAIGLGRIFGFHFLENFNYPYISKSISEFWRRWHMSLGSWFRDYVYIPLGGNRVSALKWVRNILVVWFLTGFWHGAGWNFIAWGLFFAAFLVIEKIGLKNILEKLPKIFSHVYVIFLLLLSWILFDAETISIAFFRYKDMFGISGLELINSETIYYLSSYLGVFIIAVIGSMPICKNIVIKIKENSIGRGIINVLEPVVQVSLLLIITGYLIDGSFNPFLYFRF